jgi:biopolymer transport protein ExbD
MHQQEVAAPRNSCLLALSREGGWRRSVVLSEPLMPVHPPGPRLISRVPLNFVRRGRSHERRRSPVAALSLTSMIDFLVVTVVFLLTTFSAASECPPDKRVTVPRASNAIEMIDAPLVMAWADRLAVDGSPAGNTHAVLVDGRTRRLDDLFNLLSAKRRIWKQIHPDTEFPGVAVLEVDQDVPMVVVKSLFQTAAYAGYPTISFMVHQGIGK